MKRAAVLLLALALFSTGCASTRTHADTGSGKAELYVPKESVAAYRDLLVSRMVDKGYSTLDVTSYKLSFEKEGGMGADILVGTGSRKRVTYDFVPTGDQCRVVGKLEILNGRGRVESTRSGQ